MEFKHSIGKHEFTVICNKEGILKQIEAERGRFEKDYYQSCGTIGSESGYLTEEEYNDNLDEIISKLDEILKEERLISFIESAKKKKNGTFYKNKVILRRGCNNTIFITEWHNTWIYNALSVRAESDTLLEITYSKITDTPA